MNTLLNIREYQASDQEQVLQLILNIQQQEYNIPITREDQPDLLSIKSYYQQGDGNFWVACDGDQIVGTIALLDIGNQQVALRKMFVDSQYRGKVWQTAFLLLNQAILWAKQQQVTHIYLGTTIQFVAAHRFYEKNGFEEIAVNVLPESFPVMKVDTKFYRLSTI